MLTLFIDCLAEDPWLDFALWDHEAALCEQLVFLKTGERHNQLVQSTSFIPQVWELLW